MPNRVELKQRVRQLEEEILEKKKQLVDLKHSLPPQEIGAYSFQTWDGRKVPIAELFGDREELILIHNMGKGCRYCTLWADGFNSLLPHLENRAAFVVVSPDDPATQKEFAETRGWRFHMVSYDGLDFARDMEFLGENNKFWPGVSTFTKAPDGRIHRTAWSYFGPGDDFCSVWHLFDLLGKGQNGWEPQYRYE
jgi:predicted dithiol-disulfide oxidoreductase (DUF899 family)